MRTFFLAALSLISTGLLAQTKEIAFKSHSGNMSNFKVVLENDFFDTDNSTFGLPVPKDVKTYKLDTVIYVSDSMSVTVTKEYRRLVSQPKTASKLWWTGKDTVYNHPLFTRKHSLDSIKAVLKTQGKYINPVNKIVFIGYDNKKEKKNNLIPVSSFNDTNNNSPFDKQLAGMLGIILLLSLLGGVLSWKFYQPRVQKA